MFDRFSYPIYVIASDDRPHLGLFCAEVTHENDWERTRFVSGGETAPDQTKRAKLRGKRKKKPNVR